MMYLFNSTEWRYMKRTTDNVLPKFVKSVSVKGKKGKYDFANTRKKVKSYANTPTWSKHSANSQCKAWICKKYHGY